MLFLRRICRSGRSHYKILSLLAVTASVMGLMGLALPSDERDAVVTERLIGDSNYIQQKNDLKDQFLDETLLFYKTAVLSRFKERSDLVGSTCNRLRSNTTYQNKSRLWYMPTKDVLFCPIEKSASTFWKRVLVAFASSNDHENSPFSVGIGTAYKAARNFRIRESDNLTHIFRHSNSFLFVRHPFDRLVSGWLDKFYSTHTGFWKKGIEIVKSERGIKDVVCGHDVTFNEFVNYVSKELVIGKKVDRHFTPCFYHCDVCNINFKYIGKYETLKDDSRFIMEKYGLVNKSSVFDDFEDKSEVDMIADAVDWVFSQKSKIMRCISFQCGLFRVWKRLICRGVISNKEQFPYKTEDQALELTKEELKKYLLGAHKRSKSNEVVNNREEVLAEAFLSLEPETLENMLKAFDLDFKLFGYSSYQYFMDLTKKSNPNEIYLQKCPFQ